MTSVLCAAAFGTVLAAGAHTARAQAALDDDDAKPANTVANTVGDETRYGVGLRVREVWVPRSIIELFVAKAAGGAKDTGIGVELSRRTGNFEVQLGFEYESIFIDRGIWVQNGQSPMTGGADDVEFHDFGWVTAEVTFLNHSPINKYIAIRYGGGAGIGILKGSVNRTDQLCDNDDAAGAGTPANPCHRDMTGANSDTPYNLPPVFPVINAIVGVQITPTENIVINVEGGIRTLPFFGGTFGYLF